MPVTEVLIGGRAPLVDAVVAQPDPFLNVVWLRGEHDASTAADLVATISRTIAYDDADLVVDLSGVKFMDASTIGVIARFRQLLLAQSRMLVVRSPSAFAQRVIDLSGLAAMVDLCFAGRRRPT